MLILNFIECKANMIIYSKFSLPPVPLQRKGCLNSPFPPQAEKGRGEAAILTNFKQPLTSK